MHFAELSNCLAAAVCCPIGGDLFVDPVMCADGVIYERANIEAWMLINATSPMTEEPLSHAELLPTPVIQRIADVVRRLSNQYESTRMVPRASIAAIMGQRGLTVASIQSETNTSIIVERSPTTAMVRVKGSVNDVGRAWELLDDAVVKSRGGPMTPGARADAARTWTTAA